MVKLALLIASGKASDLSVVELQHMFTSVVAVGRIEQMSELPSALMTSGQQMVASPMVAASSGTGTMYRVYHTVSTASDKTRTRKKIYTLSTWSATSSAGCVPKNRVILVLLYPEMKTQMSCDVRRSGLILRYWRRSLPQTLSPECDIPGKVSLAVQQDVLQPSSAKQKS